MAAARGTEFIGAALVGAVTGNYDRKIAVLQDELDALRRSTVAERYAAWRADAERTVSDLFRRINEATDAELSRFSIPSPPYPGEYDYRVTSLEGQIVRLREAKEKALAYVNSLAAEGPERVVTLYAADLRRIGYQP